MPIPNQKIFPDYKAPLTAEQVRILQYAVSGGSKGALFGLDVVKVDNTTYKITSGIFSKDNLVFFVTNDVILSNVQATGTFEILVKFDPALINSIPQPQAEINVYNSGTYESNDILYMRLGVIQNGVIKYDTRDYRHILRTIIFSLDEPIAELRTQGLYWFKPYCEITQRARLFIWTGTEWRLVTLFECEDPNAPDFNFTLNPISGTVQKNASSNVTVNTTATIAPRNGFTGNVSYSLENPPTGITVSGGPTSITDTSSKSSVLTFTIASNAPTGTVVLTVVATSGNLIKKQQYTLTIQEPPPFDFEFTLNETSGSVNRPTTGTVTKTVTGTVRSINQYSGTVTFSFVNTIDGITFQSSPTSVNISPTSPGTATFSFIVSSTAPISVHNIDIRATAQNITNPKIRTYALTVLEAPPTGSFNLSTTGCGTVDTVPTTRQITLTATTTGNFTGGIQLTATQTGGVTIVSPNPLPTFNTSGTMSTTVTLNITAAGSVTFTGTATQGSSNMNATASTLCTISYTPPTGGATLTLNCPTNISSSATSSSDATVTVTFTGSFTGPVTLTGTVSNGGSISFTPSTLTKTSSSSTATAIINLSNLSTSANAFVISVTMNGTFGTSQTITETKTCTINRTNDQLVEILGCVDPTTSQDATLGSSSTKPILVNPGLVVTGAIIPFKSINYTGPIAVTVTTNNSAMFSAQPTVTNSPLTLTNNSTVNALVNFTIANNATPDTIIKLTFTGTYATNKTVTRDCYLKISPYLECNILVIPDFINASTGVWQLKQGQTYAVSTYVSNRNLGWSGTVNIVLNGCGISNATGTLNVTTSNHGTNPASGLISITIPTTQPLGRCQLKGTFTVASNGQKCEVTKDVDILAADPTTLGIKTCSSTSSSNRHLVTSGQVYNNAPIEIYTTSGGFTGAAVVSVSTTTSSFFSVQPTVTNPNITITSSHIESAPNTEAKLNLTVASGTVSTGELTITVKNTSGTTLGSRICYFRKDIPTGGIEIVTCRDLSETTRAEVYPGQTISGPIEITSTGYIGNAVVSAVANDSFITNVSITNPNITFTSNNQTINTARINLTIPVGTPFETKGSLTITVKDSNNNVLSTRTCYYVVVNYLECNVTYGTETNTTLVNTTVGQSFDLHFWVSNRKFGWNGLVNVSSNICPILGITETNRSFNIYVESNNYIDQPAHKVITINPSGVGTCNLNITFSINGYICTKNITVNVAQGSTPPTTVDAIINIYGIHEEFSAIPYGIHSFIYNNCTCEVNTGKIVTDSNTLQKPYFVSFNGHSVVNSCALAFTTPATGGTSSVTLRYKVVPEFDESLPIVFNSFTVQEPVYCITGEPQAVPPPTYDNGFFTPLANTQNSVKITLTLTSLSFNNRTSTTINGSLFFVFHDPNNFGRCYYLTGPVQHIGVNPGITTVNNITITAYSIDVYGGRGMKLGFVYTYNGQKYGIGTQVYRTCLQ